MRKKRLILVAAACCLFAAAYGGELLEVPSLDALDFVPGPGIDQQLVGGNCVDLGGQRRPPASPPRPQVTRTDGFYKDLYFPPERAIPLTDRERWILGRVDDWRERGFNSNPMYLPDGVVQYVYGTTHPSIVCAPLQLTDIELQPGEILNSLNVGDPARWRFEAAISSSPGGDIQHILVKPMDIGIATSMVIATNRRSYHLRMKSTQEDFFPRVSFAYPDEVLAKGQIMQARVEAERNDNTLSETGEYLGALNFDYEITATRKGADFKPLRAYNDGVKTVLELPASVKSGEMPVLLVVRVDGRGNPFRSTETVIVNYRVQSNRFIVDSVFEKAFLVRGVGRSQERVVIERKVSPRKATS
jgi:type IV secretion system protein VirB9